MPLATADSRIIVSFPGVVTPTNPHGFSTTLSVDLAIALFGENRAELGGSEWLALRRVIVPQATRLVIPPVTNDFIALLKDSSLVSVITMVELTKVYGQLAATNYDYIGIGLLTAAIYFLLGLPIARLSRLLEARLAYMKA